VIVLVPLDELVDVLVAVRVAVPVLEFTIVLVPTEDLEIEVDPVDVRDAGADNVREEEPEEVFEVIDVLEFVGVDDPVLD
jgi:hypothetical protein